MRHQDLRFDLILTCVSNKDWMFSNKMPILELVSWRLVLYEHLRIFFFPTLDRQQVQSTIL